MTYRVILTWPKYDHLGDFRGFGSDTIGLAFTLGWARELQRRAYEAVGTANPDVSVDIYDRTGLLPSARLFDSIPF